MKEKHEHVVAPDRAPAELQDTVMLIRQAQTGSQEACDLLRKQYEPLIRSMVARYDMYDLTHQEKEDLLQEADHVFLNALSCYDTTQEEVSFGLYAKVCLHNGLVSEMRHLTYLRRLAILPVAPEEMPGEVDPADQTIAEERFAQLCGVVRASLSDLENRIWWAYVAGTPVSEIAASLGRNERSVHNAIYRIRRKLRSRLSDARSDT